MVAGGPRPAARFLWRLGGAGRWWRAGRRRSGHPRAGAAVKRSEKVDSRLIVVSYHNVRRMYIMYLYLVCMMAVVVASSLCIVRLLRFLIRSCLLVACGRAAAQGLATSYSTAVAFGRGIFLALAANGSVIHTDADRSTVHTCRSRICSIYYANFGTISTGILLH